MALFRPFRAYTPRRHLFPGRCPRLVYNIPLGLFDDAADHTYQEPSLPADSVAHPHNGRSTYCPIRTREGPEEVVVRSNNPPQSPLGKGGGKVANRLANGSNSSG
jgi:hypothetical protein